MKPQPQQKTSTVQVWAAMVINDIMYVIDKTENTFHTNIMYVIGKPESRFHTGSN